jgi:DNA-binding IclR family transcriptional regulator
MDLTQWRHPSGDAKGASSTLSNMRRGSPSVERAVQILDFLTTHPGRGFTLAELSRRLRISRATAHAVVTTLTDRALLLRHPDTNEYRLGPALIPMGAVAERGFPAFTHAMREAERLAEEFDAQCVLVFPTGEEILIVGRAGVAAPMAIDVREGLRHPLYPPLGSAVLAWAGDRAVETWLDGLGPDFTAAEREHYKAAIEAVRRRGYAVGLRVQQLADLFEIQAHADLYTLEGRRAISTALARLAHEDYLPPADEPPPDAELMGVSAPVFGPDGELLFGIALSPEARHARDVPELSRAVLRAAGRVMAAIDGRQPDPRNARPPVSGNAERRGGLATSPLSQV